MKKTKFLAICMMAAMCSFGFVACGDDDENGETGTNEEVGTNDNPA